MADVCLIVEGAYPYITGGVSSWIQSLVTNLPDVTFAIMYIGSIPDPQRKLAYTMPDNIIELREVFIHDINQVGKYKRIKYTPTVWQEFSALHEAIAVGKLYDVRLLLPILRKSGFAGLETSDLFYARESWELLVKLYEKYASEQAFVDFVWTFRFMYLTIFSIFEAILPQAEVYHAVSTGFGGLLGSLGKIRTGRPFLVTEHGLYTREREIDIMQSAWKNQLVQGHRVEKRRMNLFQQWRLNMFLFMEKLCYESADAIISITGVNQKYQMNHGADPQKMLLIPNGMNVPQLAHLREQKDQTPSLDYFLVGFVGRVVPIKDVKTFIRALKIASQTILNLQACLVGPTDEDPQYFKECQELIEMLDAASILRFTGPADVKQYYRQIDVMVLTSLSEGQPLVIMEANCAGIPAIATDVGACRELLMGVSPEDQALGASGIITLVASPQETAEAIIRLWRDEDLRLRMGRVGQERIGRYYRQEQLYNSYTQLYQHHLSQKVLR